MNIGMVVMEYRTDGGIERAAVELSRHLIPLGHEISVYASSFAAPPSPSIHYERVATWPLTTSTKLATFKLMSRFALSRSAHDLIHGHAIAPGRTDIVTLQSCHRAGMDVRKTIRGIVRSRRNFHIADALRLSYEKQSLRRGAYKKLIAVSSGLKRELCEYYDVPENDIRVIPNGVNLQEFSPANDEMKLHHRKELGIEPNHTILLFVANEFERKGLDCVIGALASIKSQEVRLLVVGRDDPRPYIEYSKKLGVSRNIVFAGPQTNLALYYRASDIFVLPTFHESFLIAGIEAAACGLPLLITKVPGPEDYLNDGINGFFIERSPDDIADKIRLLLDDHGKIRTMGSQAQLTAREYAWNRIAEQTSLLYHEVV